MRSRFATSADDSSDDFFGNPTHDFSGNSLGDGASPALPSFSAWAGAFNQHNWGTPIPVSALTGEAQEAMAAQSGPVSTVSVSSGTGFTINLLYDAAAMAAPQSFRDTIQQAANLLAASISDHITVNIKIDYSGTGGGAAAGPDAGLYEPYSLVRSNLIANASSGDTTFNSLPTGTSIQGQSQVAVWNAQLKLWGLLSPTDTTTDDGSATFATDINSNLLLGVALHELTHAMGRVPYGPQPDIFDLFRFTSSGVRLFNGAATAPAAYFSLDNGVTRLADYGKTSDSSDFLNSGIQGPNDPFNEFYSGTTLQKLTTVDLKQMDALGFHLLAATNSPPVISTPSGTNVLGTPSQVYQLSSLFAASDPDNDTLTYSIFDATTGASTGHIKINGVTQAEGQWIQLTQAQLSQTTFTAGTAGLDTLTFSVSDPTHNTQSSIKVGSNSAPVIATPSGTSVSGTAGQVYQLSSLFTASDPDNDPLTYYIYDGTAGASTGHIKINGVTQAEGQWVLVTQAQLSQTTFTAGTGGTDTLYFSVYDPMQHNAFSSVQVAALKAANSAPVIATPSGANVLGTPSQVYQLSSLFAASDPDSDTLTYSIFDATTGASTGHIKINGVTQAEGQWIQLTQAQLSQTTFTAGTAGLDTLTFSVSDPTHNTQSSIKVGSNSAPVIATPSGANVLGTPNQVFQLSSLFTASDPDSDPLSYYIYDATVGSSTGHIKINGVTQAEGQWVQLTQAQLSQTTFTAGTGGTDNLYFSVYDPMQHNAFNGVSVTAAAGVKPALSASSSVAPDALNHQPLQIAAYDGFVFNNPQNIDGHSAGATSGPSFFGGQDGNSHSGPGNESGSHQPGGPIDGLHWDPVGEVTPPVSGIHVTLHPTDHFLV